MTLMQAAMKWGLSPNWVRELVRSGRVPAVLVDAPVKYYDIPDDTPKPVSMARWPLRKNAAEEPPKPDSLKRRVYRAKPKAKAQKNKKK